MEAAIDIGSNTVRLLIGEVRERRVRVIKQAVITTRLGSTKVGERLSAAGRAKTVAALRRFAEMMRLEGVEAPPVVAATSAVREAADGEDFAAEIWAELGWRLSILSGEQEAACSYAGAASVGEFRREEAEAAPAVIDVGGGSTELICRQSDGGVLGKSVKVGAVRLYSGEVGRERLRPMLTELLEVLPELPDNKKRSYISVGGTITLVAALLENLTEYSREAVSGRWVSVEEIAALQNKFLGMAPAERLAAYPLLEGREDIITAGLEIYLNLAELLGADGFIASDAGLLDGLLLRRAE